MDEKSRKTLIFDEAAHTYTMDGATLTSVTTFIKSFMPEVSPASIIKSKRKEWSTRERCPYNDMTDEQIISSWEALRDEAAKMGTRMHTMIEKSIEEELSNRQLYGRSWVPVHNKEEEEQNEDLKVEMQAYRKFRLDNPTWQPVATETTVFDLELGVCGTFDAIFYDTKELCYILLDWKRCKNISSGYEGIESTHPTLRGIACGNYTQYMLQLYVYQRCIEKRCNNVDYDVKILPMDGATPIVYNPHISRYAENIKKCYVINMHPTFHGFYQKLALNDFFVARYAEPFIESLIAADEGRMHKKRGIIVEEK